MVPWLVEPLHAKEPLTQRTNYKLYPDKPLVVQGSTIYAKYTWYLKPWKFKCYNLETKKWTK